MKKYISIAAICVIIFPLFLQAQLFQNDDGSYSIGTLDGTASLLGQDANTVDLMGESVSTRTVNLDESKSTIVSSEAEVKIFQDDQVISDESSSTIVDVSLFFQKAYNGREQAKEDIKREIEREVQSAIAALELDSSKNTTKIIIIEKQAELFDNIDSYFEEDASISDPRRVDELNQSINTIFRQIETSINGDPEEGESEFQFKRVTLAETLLAYQKTLEERQALFANRNNEVFKDSDGDGLSDFDEIYIYRTDPFKAFTVPGKLNDKEKIIAGIDPLSEEEVRIVYEDPRLDRDALEVMNYSLLGVDFIPATESVDGKESLTVKGIALPNSLVTIYIFSDPRVVTTDTDNEGKWEYELRNSLENGEHTVYVTTTDNKGRILAKSTPTLLSKSAQAAAIGVLVAESTATPVSTVFSEYSFIFLIALFLIGVVVTISLIIQTRKEIADEKVFIPIHPGATPFIEPEVTPRMRDDSLYPNLK